MLPPAIFLMGPTASGKSQLAIELAKQLEGEIISVDSALVYRGMDIGTAKPDLNARAGIPHHLIDILDPSESFSTGEFKTQALQLMQDITHRQKLPILTGGTMLYFSALNGGLSDLPKADPEIRAELNAQLARLGSEKLHAFLKTVDPDSALRIHPNDPQRIQRAIEVYQLTGKPLSQFFSEQDQSLLPYQVIKLIVAPKERSSLHQIIANRFHAMLAQGFIAEVEYLLQRGDLDESMPAIRAVGYRQVWAYLKGEMDKATMIDKGIIATRQLAKRQFTWLRKETDAINLTSYEPDLLAKTLQFLNEKLKL